MELEEIKVGDEVLLSQSGIEEWFLVNSIDRDAECFEIKCKASDEEFSFGVNHVLAIRNHDLERYKLDKLKTTASKIEALLKKENCSVIFNDLSIRLKYDGAEESIELEDSESEDGELETRFEVNE